VSSAPIGVFDSGVGGLTVARAILDQLPREQVLYLGDTANGPYGPRPIAHVREHALAVMDELVDQGVKMLVIAYNTASAAMFRDARERFEQGHGIPVVEVIQPAVRQAVRRTRTKRIGVIGTEGTINSHAYVDAFVADPSIVLTQAAAPRFVEAGVTSRQLRDYLETLSDPREQALAYSCAAARRQFYFDGNKRTARLMMNGVLMCHGYDASSVSAVRRIEFNKNLMTQFNARDAKALTQSAIDCRIKDTE